MITFVQCLLSLTNWFNDLKKQLLKCLTDYIGLLGSTPKYLSNFGLINRLPLLLQWERFFVGKF